MKNFIIVTSFFLFTNSPIHDNTFVLNYYLELKNIHDPKTLTGNISEKSLREVREFYISYSDKSKRVIKIEFLRKERLEFSLGYSYQGRVIKKLTKISFIDRAHKTCEIKYDKKARTTKCFNDKGLLTLDEIFFTRTGQYSIVTYDSTGAETLNEYGKY